MRSTLLTGLCLFTTVTLFAQMTSNAVLFTENGEKFHVILNGARQNDAAETQVKITGLNAEFYKMKVIFEDAALGVMDKTLYLVPGTERAFAIKKNNKNEYVLRMISETPLAQLPPPPPAQRVVVYNPNPAPASTVTVTESTTTVTQGTAENVSMGVNMGGTGVNMNISITDNMGGGVATQSTTTTTYSSTTTTSGNPGGYPQPQPVQQEHYVMPGYGGPVGCPWPMSDSDFAGVRSSISSKSFEDSKLQIAKQVIGSNCLFSSQVRDIMGLFDFEETRLDFAKFAYGYTYDLGNYYKVNDAFEFELSIDELNRHIGR